MKEIKLGDKVHVREGAPSVYNNKIAVDWRYVDSTVLVVEDDAARIKWADADGVFYLTIPLKYLIKVEEEEAKEAKFHKGDKVSFQGREYALGRDGVYDPMKSSFVYDIPDVCYDVCEYDLKPYAAPTEEKPKIQLDYLKLRQPIISVADPNQDVKYEIDWTLYTADLAKEIAVKSLEYSYGVDPERIADYAFKVAKAVVAGLRKGGGK